MSQDGTGFAQIIQPDLMADSTVSTLIPMNMHPALRLVLSLMFVNVCVVIIEG